MKKKYIIVSLAIVSFLTAGSLFFYNTSRGGKQLIECSSSQTVIILNSKYDHQNNDWIYTKYNGIDCNIRLLHPHFSNEQIQKVRLEIKLSGKANAKIEKKDFILFLSNVLEKNFEGFVRIQELRIGDGYIY
jgi:hypothetical protein